MEHSVSYPFSTDRLWQIISTEQYWRFLLESINSSHGVLESFEATEDTVTVSLQQGIPEEKLPSIVTKVRPGDLEIPRRNTFRRSGDTISGAIEASVTGAPATIRGTLTTQGEQATTDYRADITVSLPLVGGKIEKAIMTELVALLDREHDKTVDFEANNR